MKHTALLIISLLLSHCVMAQQTFRRRQCGTAMLMEREAAAYSKGQRAISTQNNYVPHTGTITIPVVLVNFKDVKFKINEPKKAFDQLFNSDKQADLGNGNHFNYGSVAKYFRDMSNGEFTPKFKVYGPVTVDKPETDYGGKREKDNNDENPWQLVEDALKLVEDQVTGDDIKSFCSDGKTIDCVYIVYAGLGQNDGGDGTTVWANCSTTGGKTLGGKEVRWYTMSGELSPVKIKDKDNSTVNLADKGIGSIQLMILLLSLATILREYEPQNIVAMKESDHLRYPTIIIEEPEQNLHPKVQSLLADLFLYLNKEYHCKFVVETHSEYLIRKTQVLVSKENYEDNSSMKENNPFMVYYFDGENEKEPYYPMEYRTDGNFSNEFGTGFFDAATKLLYEIL